MAPSGPLVSHRKEGCHQDKPLLGIRLVERVGKLVSVHQWGAQGSGAGLVAGNSWRNKETGPA